MRKLALAVVALATMALSPYPPSPWKEWFTNQVDGDGQPCCDPTDTHGVPLEPPVMGHDTNREHIEWHWYEGPQRTIWTQNGDYTPTPDDPFFIWAEFKLYGKWWPNIYQEHTGPLQA